MANLPKLTEFEEIRHELSQDVQILGVATSYQKKIITDKEASIYFYSTGEKDAALIFFATDDEVAYIEVQPFLSETRTVFETLNPESVAKKEDILQTKMDEVYKEWIKSLKFHNQKGFSLIEVLIAITLFAFFVTAFLTAQGYNVSDSHFLKNN